MFKELAKQTESPSWNFNKYLIDRDGNVVEHFGSSTSPDDKACLDDVKYLLSFLPSNNLEDPPVLPSEDPVDRKLTEIAEIKMPDLNAIDIEGAKLQVAGTARSMGIRVEG